MAGSSTADLRLRPTRDDDVEYVLVAEADPDNAPFLAPSPREEHLAFMRDPEQHHLVAETGGERVGFVLLRLHRAEGFVEEGTPRDALYYGGRFESLVVMSLLRPEWAAR